MKKLSKKYLSPYEIIFKLSLNNFTQYFKPLPALVVIDREPEYEISKIINSKINHWRVCKLLYKVVWLGYENTEDNSKWLLALELTHAQNLLEDFYVNYSSKPDSFHLL